MYTYMKYLKHVLNLNVSSYFIKSQLNKEHSQSIMESCINAETSMGGLEINKSRWDVALVALISQPDFMSAFGGKIDLKKSSKEGHICLSEESGNKNPEAEAEITETTPALIASQAWRHKVHLSITSYEALGEMVFHHVYYKEYSSIIF